MLALPMWVNAEEKSIASAPPVKPEKASSAGASGNTHTKVEVEALIQKAGQTQPDWFAGVTANYPQTLDLTWGDPRGRNAQKDLKEFIWSVINPNPTRWKDGTKLLHQVLNVNKADPEKLKRTMNALGECYHNFFADYARAAFWLQKAETNNELLADCYFRLGNKDMAKQVLDKYGYDDTRQGGVIKMWADIGELDEALKMADGKAQNTPDAAYFVAGDCLKLAGRYKDAMDYYEKVLKVVAKDTQTAPGRLKWNQDQARASIEAIKLFELLDLKHIPDGKYSGTSMGYSGNVTVEVTTKSAKIESVKVTQQTEHQCYASLTVVPEKIITKQSVKGVDTYSSATVTSNAIINASAKALASGMK
jgi:uncharacterized protein with FMN-binding domain